MFIGSYNHTIDSKNRVSIPSKLRKYLKAEANDTFILTRGIEKCIDIYPLDQWKELVSKLEKLNQFRSENAKFVRMFLHMASEDTLDSQARLLIPQNLTEYASIEKDVLICGAINKIELWNPEAYKEYENRQAESYEEVAEKVMTQQL